jgi:four helix bundle protein
MQDYHDLLVWQRAHAFVLEVRKIADGFPPGYSNLRNQIISASESITFNIVEGCGAATRAEFARFMDITIKSTNEAQYQLELARDYGILDPELWEKMTSQIIEIRKMAHGFRKKLREPRGDTRRRRRGEER